MSCRTTAAGSAMATVARLDSGLNDIQTLSIFHTVRREADRRRDLPTPSTEQWQQFLNDQNDLVSNNTAYTEARRRSVLARLQEARDETPDAQAFHTYQQISAQAQRAGAALRARLSTLAVDLEQTPEQVQALYEEYEGRVDRARDAEAPEGYDANARRALRRDGLPSDRGTYAALRDLEAQVRQHRLDTAANSPQRITRQAVPNPGPAMASVVEYGYDNGRLEIVLAEDPNRVRAYCNVPEYVWHEMQTGGDPDGTYEYSIRNRRGYRYASEEEAVLAGVAPRCSDCGQFASQGHSCPQRAERIERERVEAEQARERAAAARLAAETMFAEQAEVTHPHLRANAELIADGQPLPQRPSIVDFQGRARSDRLTSLLPDSPDVRSSDYLGVPSVTTFREAAAVAPQRSYVSFSGTRLGSDGTDGFGIGAGSFVVEGRVTLDNPATGHWALDTRELACTCTEYQANYDCPHMRAANSHLRDVLVPRNADASPDGPAAVALQQSIVQDALRSDWMASGQYADEARSRWRPSDPEDTYSTNFAAFQADVDAAQARVRAGQSAVPFMTENATDGICAPGGRAFGIEIEFDGGDIDAIGQELYEAGLTSSSWQQEYHSAAADGYSSDLQGGWSFEEDCTVSGEIVSPILHDTPETWRAIEKVCEIVRRNGGTASSRTGSHVHVSAGSYDHRVENHTELIRMANQHEDVLYRISSNPESRQHRPMQWCGPNTDTPPTGYRDVYQAQGYNDSHGFGVNLQSVEGDSTDHVEIRYWDGTLDPAVIQAQVKISAAMVEAAQRNAAIGESTRGREPVGSHALRQRAMRGNSRRNLTAEEQEADTATARSFMDTLFRRREDKAQIAALFSVTNWVRR